MAPNGAQPDACEVCGRTILNGERTREYVSPDGEHRAVCDLCRARVEAAGWVRAEDAQSHSSSRDGEAASGRARRWLADRAERVRARIEEARNAAEEEEKQMEARPAPPRPVRPETPERRLRRAIDEFNGSEHRRTVAGLTKSLGVPRVSAVMPPDAPHEVRLTVAWDLSWYQWEVRLADDPARVRALAKGSELDELRDDDRAWNARVSDDGRLQLVAAGNGAG
jgi:hypothetical protein